MFNTTTSQNEIRSVSRMEISEVSGTPIVPVNFCFGMFKASKLVTISSWNINGAYKRIDGQRVCKLDEDEFKETRFLTLYFYVRHIYHLVITFIMMVTNLFQIVGL